MQFALNDAKRSDCVWECANEHEQEHPVQIYSKCYTESSCKLTVSVGKKNLWLRFHLKQLETHHNTTECFVCQKSWLKLTQMPSTCNCTYSQENIRRFKSFSAHIPKIKHIRIYYVIEFWMKPFVFVSKWSGMLTSNSFGVDFGNKSHLKTKRRFLLSNSIISTLWRQKNKYWKWENDTHVEKERERAIESERKREKAIWCAQQRPRPNQVKNHFY